MTNELAKENSPYLLQHAENPVEWYPWGPAALEKARLEDKPIFLSIGYAACHWCHVMAHESFEDPRTAALMNEHFVNIKVDREERPDLDSIYMSAVVALTGQGGWPMSVFMTPQGEPFFGGTYFPPQRRYNMPAFTEVLESVARIWRGDRQQLLQSSQQITAHLQNANQIHAEFAPLEAQTLDKAAFALAQAYDWKFGGWGSAPKFPQPMTIEFLLRRASRGDRLAMDLATHELDAMARGGMYDVVGGGFARYSTDNNWLVPHFEKMLYDNAQLARVYLHAYLVTGAPFYRRICEETLDFMLRELRHPMGGFFSSLDADSEGEEGKYYTWTPAEIRSALPEQQEADFIIAVYAVTETGNFEGVTILQRAAQDDLPAEQFDLPAEQVPTRLQTLHKRLLQFRQKRIPPATDDKVLTAWNALALRAFSEAARYLDRPDYLAVAIRNAHFLLAQLQAEDRLLRSWREGQARHNAYLEDYAALILALLALYQSDPDVRWYRAAEHLAEEMVIQFSDPGGGFFDTRVDHDRLLTRPKDLQDNATPCGNSLAALALLQIVAFNGRGDWRTQVEEFLGSLQPAASRYPTAFANWLCAMDFAMASIQEVALIGAPDDPHTQALKNVIWSAFRPDLIVAQSALPLPHGAPALLMDRFMRDHLPTAYVCRNFTCKLPVNQPEELQAQLEGTP